MKQKSNSLIVGCAIAFAVGHSAHVRGQGWQAVDNGLSGPVRCILADSLRNRLIVGGEFFYVNGNLQPSIAAWDGVQLGPVSAAGDFSCNPLFTIGDYGGSLFATDCSAMNLFGGTVWSLTDSLFEGTAFCFVQKDSLFFVGGAFGSVGSVANGGLAVWRGGQWRDIALPYQHGVVADIAFFRDTLYVVAQFPDSTGDTHTKILRRTCSCQGWIDISWGLVGASAWASSLEVYRDKLYVAGSFSKVDGSVGNSIMAYDGSVWGDVENGIDQSGSYGQVFAMHVWNDLLLVGGFFQSTNGVPASNIAAWNGSNWCGLGGNFNQSIMAVEDWNNELYVGGRFTEIDSVQARFIAKYAAPSPAICGDGGETGNMDIEE
ncbi:MAG TPA: hypothetical protein PK950_01745 [Candidatus Paceibacterota bacterium]|nr:hypothetical protein [Candidatus Paceibacterota bacterium]